MLTRIIIFLCRIKYKKYKKPIFYIRGTDKHYPRYLMYTEVERIRKKMEGI